VHAVQACDRDTRFQRRLIGDAVGSGLVGEEVIGELFD